MCGIIARVGDGDAVRTLLEGLRNLDYRGYDSAGIAVKNDGSLSVHKQAGKIGELSAGIEAAAPTGPIGVGHTRWSTHGSPTDDNAHPHTDCTKSVAVVHNGIIENYDTLRSELHARGHEFASQTDTEVIPHLVREGLDDGLDPEAAFRRAIDNLSGSYAVAALFDREDAIYATRSGSPLVLGVDEDQYFLASDIPAFLDWTDEVAYLQDGDVVTVRRDGYEIERNDGTPVVRATDVVEWDPEDVGKGRFDHYMLKEINEQPAALRQTIHGRIDGDRHAIELDDFPPGSFADVERVQLLACGTSYHAALYCSKLLNGMGIPARAQLANEYANDPLPVSDGTLVIGVSQSGETADTLNALRAAQRRGARTVVVTNVVESTADRECDDSLYIRAGPEIGVAATKTFTSQVASLALLSERIRRDVRGSPSEGHEKLFNALAGLPERVREVLERSSARDIATKYRDSDACFFIGRGFGYPVAREGALKFKEISYKHAEGFPAGELKHGPLALVTPDTPVLAVFTGQHEEKTLSNIREVESRGAPVVALTDDTDGTVADIATDLLEVPSVPPYAAGILANVQLQLISYYAAKSLNRPIDKPRNLAKSVTVE